MKIFNRTVQQKLGFWKIGIYCGLRYHQGMLAILSSICSLRNSSLFLKELTFKCAIYLSFSYEGPSDPGFQPHYRKYWDMILSLQNYLRYWKTHHCHYKNLPWVENNSYQCHHKIFRFIRCTYLKHIKWFTKLTLPSSFKFKPSLSKFSAPILLLSVNPNQFNLQTRFRTLFKAITLSFNLLLCSALLMKLKHCLSHFLYIVDLFSQSIPQFHFP